MSSYIQLPNWAVSFISTPLPKLFDASVYRDFFNLLNGEPNYETEELLKMLQVRLLSVKAVLDEAEEEKIMNPNVILWVEKLQDALDDAENLWFEIVIEACGYKSSWISNTLEKLSNYFTSVNLRLGEIIKRLEQVVNIKNVIDLKERKRERESSLSLPTTSFLDNRETVYGRGSDKEIITAHLSSGVERILVVAIVGMAGVGKTTLAQVLFNSLGNFNLKSWVYVSERSNLLDLTQKIYASVTSSNTDEITKLDLRQVEDKLNLKLQRKRFLLVLDDFWIENQREWDRVKRALTNEAHGSVVQREWDRVKRALTNEAHGSVDGSVVIVTTRNENVAHILSATLTHTLHPLEFEDCWSIFDQHAFGTNDAAGDETLKQIGREIVRRKCSGLPLSAKVLGSLLRSTKDPLEWNNTLHSKIWDLPAHRCNILPSLLVSYQHLPLHLKRCFAFCSLFPKAEPIQKRILIYIWMAHDLLASSKTSKTMEEVGDEYLCELMSRSFLQQSKRNDSDFEMHDLMSELAQYVGGETFFRHEVGNLDNVPKKVRHLSFLSATIDNTETRRAFLGRSQYRTFLPFTSSSFTSPSGSPPILVPVSNSLTHPFLQFVLQELPSLRVLSLSNFSIPQLPSSIKNLKLLRFLNLSNSGIVKLPSAVSLPNLVTLLLSGCDELERLPSDLPELANLRHLDVSGRKLQSMPKNFRKLKSLQILTTFFVSTRHYASKVSELEALTQLCGTLSIVNLKNVQRAAEALDAKLYKMKFLKELNLEWRRDVINPFEQEGVLVQEKQVLDYLRPHDFLQKLKIEGYGGRVLSQWLSTSVSKMVSLYLIRCSNCLSLPPLGQLCSLKTLHIEEMTSIESVSHEFYGNVQAPHFRSLKTLQFKGMSRWETWIAVPDAQFPRLQKLCMVECPRLTGILQHQMPLLESLEIRECGTFQLIAT